MVIKFYRRLFQFLAYEICHNGIAFELIKIVLLSSSYAEG